MPKIDDTNTIPDKLESAWLKRFFKTKFGIPVRVRTLSGKAGYIDVWIMSDRSRSSNRELRYSHAFPPELGNRCMRAVYPSHADLCNQNWGGNILGHSITMVDRQWRTVLQGIIDNPITV